MPSSAKLFEKWNRKIHFYFGLYFLFFLWLFSLTGLLLNHGEWAMAMGANERRETKYEQAVRPLSGESDVDLAKDLMRQLNLSGEINWPAAQQRGFLAFNVSRPLGAHQVRVDLTTWSASVQRFDNSGMGTFRILHTFSGSRYIDTAERDWALTSVWVLAMDAVAIGLIIMVLGSYYMWFRLKQKRRLGMIVLAGALLSCALFVTGIFDLTGITL